MGLFSIAKDVVNMVKDAREAAAQEREANEKRPSVALMEFTPIPAEIADTLADAKAGFLGGGDKKKFIACIREGKAEYAEVAVVQFRQKTVEYREDDTDKTNFYVKVANMDGTVLKEDVAVAEYPAGYVEHSNAPMTQSADVIDPSLYKHMFVIHYYLGKKEYFLAIKPSEFKDLSKIVKFVDYHYECLSEGTGYDW
ncbi:MAG: hypothetical protein K6G23_11035 [Lachnospiraceae bacterium]|nr:hypothetical protein [Lachnospiraceae bacterium]